LITADITSAVIAFLRAPVPRVVTRITQKAIGPPQRRFARTLGREPSTDGWVENPNPDQPDRNLKPNPRRRLTMTTRKTRLSLLALAATALVATTALTTNTASAFGRFGGGGGYHFGHGGYHFGGFHRFGWRPYHFGHYGWGYRNYWWGRYHYPYRWWGWYRWHRYYPRPIVLGAVGGIGAVGGAAVASAPAMSAPAPQAQPNCLVKQYLPNGAVAFADTCTNEQAVGAAQGQPGPGAQ
jgi:hypothetical protein